MAMACTKAQEYGECGDCREVRMVFERGLEAGRSVSKCRGSVSAQSVGGEARVSAKLTQGHISRS